MTRSGEHRAVAVQCELTLAAETALLPITVGTRRRRLAVIVALSFALARCRRRQHGTTTAVVPQHCRAGSYTTVLSCCTDPTSMEGRCGRTV